jgi:exosortase/archaeosortase family protein
MGFLDFKFTKKLNPAQKRMWNITVFLLRVIVFSVPLYLLISFSSALFPLQVVVASQVAWILQAMGFTVTQVYTGVTVYSGASDSGFLFLIDPDCTAWKSMLFAFALIFAVPRVKYRKRLYGLVFAIPVIWLVNLFRIVGSVLIEQSHGLQTALFVHDVMWQFGLIALVLVVWGIWLKWSVPRKKA